jgi:hypothetical protein
MAIDVSECGSCAQAWAEWREEWRPEEIKQEDIHPVMENGLVRVSITPILTPCLDGKKTWRGKGWCACACNGESGASRQSQESSLEDDRPSSSVAPTDRRACAQMEGMDREGRPIVYVRPRFYNPADQTVDAVLRLTVRAHCSRPSSPLGVHIENFAVALMITTIIVIT